MVDKNSSWLKNWFRNQVFIFSIVFNFQMVVCIRVPLPRWKKRGKVFLITL